MKRKHARPWLTHVVHRGMVHWVNRSTGGMTPSLLLECAYLHWRATRTYPVFVSVPTEAKFTGRDADCMLCLTVRASEAS